MPELRPKNDEVFLYLAERSLRGEEPVFFAAVPMEKIVPFDSEYDPEAHPVGREAVKAVMQSWEQGQVMAAWVYPRADKYVLSDDYIILAAARHGKPDYIPCYIVGRPLYEGVKDVQKLSPEAVREALGFG